MKHLLLLFSLLVIGSISAQEINWMSMNEALEAQKKEPKKILMDVYTTWCGPCKLMDKKTFGDKKVIAFVNENFYAVKFNAQGPEEIFYQDFNYTNPNYRPERKGRNANHLFTDALKISGFPSIVFFKKNGDIIQAITGYKTPQQIEIYLRMVANDDYAEITTMKAWESYQKNFKGTF